MTARTLRSFLDTNPLAHRELGSTIRRAGVDVADQPPIPLTMSFNAQITAEDAWSMFTADLALCLSDLGEDDFLILTAKAANRFVQFAGQGAFGMRMEATSNNYLAPPGVLTVEDYRRMAELGWQFATDSAEQDQTEKRSADGSPNFFIDAGPPLDFAAFALTAVASLREVYKVQQPGQLSYKAFSRDKTQIRFPSLRIKRAKD